MKTEVDTLDATPSKRTYLSIIADYEINKAICELVDNGLDVWVRRGRKGDIKIEIFLDQDQQTITVLDNAGGLPRNELHYIVGPGQTGSDPTDQTIGIFGVGTKRAVVALAQDITIRTRFAKKETYQIEFDDRWIEDGADWSLALYKVDDIDPGTTVVDLQKLRFKLTEEAASILRDHLSATYGKFLRNGHVVIELDGVAIQAEFFDTWSYPPGYGPRHFTGELLTHEGRQVRVDILGGLSDQSSPTSGEYGVYFYCNDRLIARAKKTMEVGFARGLAGLPHPKIALTKVIVSLHGDASSMPWNSSKSDINTNHEIFRALQSWLIEIVKYYASLSRGWMGEWPDKVFAYGEGKVEDVEIGDFPKVRRTFAPPVPKSRPRFADVVAQQNQKVGNAKPWVRGLYEGVIAVDAIMKMKKLEQKNRLALILLDSTLEIAFKEYLVNEITHPLGDAGLLKIFAKRSDVHIELKKYVTFTSPTWNKIEHYYKLRCELIHKKAWAGISDTQIDEFRAVVETVLKKLYKLKFKTD